MEELKRLQEERLVLAAKMKEIGDRQATWTAEDRKAWDAVNTDYDAVMAKITAANAQIEQQNQVAERLAAINSYQPHNSRIGRDGGTIERGPVNGAEFGQANREEQWGLAIQGWMRTNHDPSDAGPVTAAHQAAATACGVQLNSSTLRINLNPNFRQVRNALSGQTGASGGFTYGDSFVTNLEEAMLAYGAMFQVADVIRTTTGEPMRWPTANDTSNSGRQIGESGAVTTLDPTFAQVVWNAYKFTSDEILVPFELLRDNAVNLAAILPNMLGTRLGRIQNTKYTTGSGAGTSWGVVNRAYAGVTTASSTAIAFDEIIDLEHSLDPSRRKMPGVGYMFHDSILKAIRKLKNGNGDYLWQAGANAGAPDTLNTYPYTVNQDMASSIATTAITMLFGDFSQYKIRQVGAIRMYRLVERHRENDQDAFLAFVEGDGNLLDSGDHPVRKMTQV